MPKVDLATIPQTSNTGYPAEYAAAVRGRWVRRLGPALELSDFGVSHVVLKPGACSSQRHWHEEEDEYVVMLAGEATLVEEEGRAPMYVGDMAVFPKNRPSGHQLVNESDSDCAFLAFGRPPTGHCHYPDIDMDYAAGVYRRKDGSPF